MEAVNLQNRIDRKYLLHRRDLPGLLSELQEHYRILDIAGQRQHRYESLYLDTPDHRLYYLHHNGKPERIKVRYRRYLDSGLVYFEVKHKTSRQRTLKYRLPKADWAPESVVEDLQALGTPFAGPAGLCDQLWISYHRITLVGIHQPERLTIDLGLTYRLGSCVRPLDPLVVVELKRNRESLGSPAAGALRQRRVYRSGFSKYAIGMALLGGVKANAFKPVLLKVNKIVLLEPTLP